MSPERRVTVVIPTYNRQESLRRCLVALCDSDLDGIRDPDGPLDRLGPRSRLLRESSLIALVESLEQLEEAVGLHLRAG